MAKTSFDEKIVGLKATFEDSRSLIEKQIKSKNEEIERLKKELELKTFPSADIDLYVNELKNNLSNAKEENTALELEILDLKRELALTEPEIKNYVDEIKSLHSRLAEEQSRMTEAKRVKKDDFTVEIKKTLQNKIEEWKEGGYSEEEIKKEKEKWLRKIQFMERELEDASIILGIKQKRETQKVPVLKMVFAGMISGAIIAAVIMFTKYLRKDISYPAPYSNPSAIIWDGKNLWSTDWLTQNIIKHNMDETLSVNRKIQLSINPFGLAWDGENFWSSDSWAKKINKHLNDGSLTIEASYTSPSSNPVGLSWDGKNLWSVDSNTDMIYKHKMTAQLPIISAYNTPGNSPSGIFWDGKNLWSIDSGLNRIYRHKMDNTLSVKNIYIPRAYLFGKARLVGMTGDGKNIWTVAEGINKIYKHRLSSMVKLK